MLSERLINILNTINDEVSRILLIDMSNKKSNYPKDQMRKTNIFNKMKSIGVTSIDVAEHYQTLKSITNNKETEFNIIKFIKFMYGDLFEDKKITRFSYRYEVLRKKIFRPVGEPIDESEIKFDPKNNIRSTFLSLVTETYPHGHEDEVRSIVTQNLTRDIYSNYYIIIGKSETM